MSGLPEVKLFDRSNFDAITWPETEEGIYARKYLTPLVLGESTDFVRNVRTKLAVLAVDDVRLPITINDGEYDNSWVCSPRTQYVTYGRAELINLGKPFVRYGTEPLLWFADALLHASSANRIIAVNNWLLSTNIYPEVTAKQVQAITDTLVQRFPSHVIQFRSVPGFGETGIRESLARAGYELVTGRQVWLNDYQTQAIAKSRSVQRDLALFKKSKYRLLEPHEIPEKQIPRLVQLYNQLYLEKYPDLNPQFTEKFVQLTLSQHLFTYRALEHAGKIDGFYAYFIRNGTLCCPLLGYDLSLPRELGLYRMLCSHFQHEAAKNKLLLHGSAGAGDFKKSRGAVSRIEYNAFYTKHLSARRAAAYKVLSTLSERIGKPLLERYEF